YESIIGRIRGLGIEPIFVLLPQVRDNDIEVIPILRDYVADCPVIDLATPSKNEMLYEQELWIDPYHIGGDGAVVLSKFLAQEVAATLMREEINITPQVEPS